MTNSDAGQFTRLHHPTPRPRLLPLRPATQIFDVDVRPSGESLETLAHGRGDWRA